MFNIIKLCIKIRILINTTNKSKNFEDVYRIILLNEDIKIKDVNFKLNNLI